MSFGPPLHPRPFPHLSAGHYPRCREAVSRCKLRHPLLGDAQVVGDLVGTYVAALDGVADLGALHERGIVRPCCRRRRIRPRCYRPLQHLPADRERVAYRYRRVPASLCRNSAQTMCVNGRARLPIELEPAGSGTAATDHQARIGIHRCAGPGLPRSTDPVRESPATIGPADEAIWTGLGSDREYQSPAPASVITNTAMRPASSPRDNESRRSLMAMERR